MNKAPRYLLTDQFDLGMLSSLTADITLTEISLADVCQLIEQAECDKKLGLHGGWAMASGPASAEVQAILHALSLHRLSLRDRLPAGCSDP